LKCGCDKKNGSIETEETKKIADRGSPELPRLASKVKNPPYPEKLGETWLRCKGPKPQVEFCSKDREADRFCNKNVCFAAKKLCWLKKKAWLKNKFAFCIARVLLSS
jgi:hypothetical protein